MTNRPSTHTHTHTHAHTHVCTHAPTQAPTRTHARTYTRTCIHTQIKGLRLVLVDNMLGLHLPIVQANISEVGFTIADVMDTEGDLLEEQFNMPFRLMAHGHGYGLSSGLRRVDVQDDTNNDDISETKLDPHDTATSTAGGGGGGGGRGLSKARNISSSVTLWAEYFNSPLRCWEPLLEPFKCLVVVERCLARGQGMRLVW